MPSALDGRFDLLSLGVAEQSAVAGVRVEFRDRDGRLLEAEFAKRLVGDPTVSRTLSVVTRSQASDSGTCVLTRVTRRSSSTSIIE